MSQSALETQEYDGVTVIILGEQYDNLDEPALLAAADELLEIARTADPPQIVVDMGRTKFFGSAFLGTLFRVWRRLTSRGGKMCVCSATGPCAEVLEVTQVNRLWDLHETREAAVESMKS
ncbi:MAG: STAS domain-containing protein [Planctomycetaceae bacterium]|jgi:anti-sigma B factor antagonist|nr:STAS domain-containing protein [Planctomycetaceae bacterium]MDA0809932.1 STAS domain-containing protein [Planctomycetota bacterium]MDA0917742.1 STAS domain-containing protein [Planctomycetota bacterium]